MLQKLAFSYRVLIGIQKKIGYEMFDHEKLDVYAVELEFVCWLTDFLEEISEYPAAQRRELVDQLDRASLSVFV